ncbi:MAG: glycosyltransferase family 4 protein, partial [Magnetococcales bacterium]|nr:glycosyltransferase family 4 protein [Magnetococcales bacterium]
CPEFTPYHEAFFDGVAADGHFDLCVHVMMDTTHTHPFASRSSRPYEWHLARNARRGIDPEVLRRLSKERSDAWFLVASYRPATLAAAMYALARQRRPFLYWTDTPLPETTQWNAREPDARPWWLRLARRRLLHWIYAHAHRTLATGDFGVAASVRLGCPPEKCVVFPYWVPLGDPPDRLRDTERPPLRTLVGIGQLIHRKGWEFALRAVADARRQGAEVTLILIGDGADRRLLEDQAAQLGLADRVRFPGWLHAPEIARHLRMADALIHPARWEPYGVVVLEAMAAGVPVLGSEACGAAVDRVIPEVSGFLHAVGDVASLTRQIVRLANDGPLLHRMRVGARESAEAWPIQRGIDLLKQWTRAGGPNGR